MSQTAHRPGQLAVLAALLITAAPLLFFLPGWVAWLFTVMLAGRAWGVWRGSTLPPRWLVLLAVVVPVVLLWLTLRTLVGREGGVALLLLLVGFKAFETQNLRDWRVLLTLGFFLAAMPLLFDQSPLAASWLVLTLVALTWAMALLAGTPPAGSGRTAVVSLLLALPLMLVLFVAMPRLPGPLWSMPDSRHTASTGLADSMEPGSISQLIPRHDPVFSVVFNEPAPPRRALYWRVMTFDDFDGQRWSNLHAIQQERVSLSGGQVWHYSLTTRPEEGRLPALDYPLPGGADTALAQGGTLRQLTRNDDLRRYRLASASGASVYARLSAQEQAFYRRLPAGNPQARQLAESLWQRSPDDRAWVQAALEHFRLEGFRYTLTPPRLAENSIDQFLFLTRQGFCEHYAGALTFLARAAGLPARVVVGYQGGEYNPVGRFWQIRSSDAHAWSEIWLPSRQQWLRVDATAAIAPNRVEQSIEQSVAGAAETLPLTHGAVPGWWLAARQNWQTAAFVWQQWVVGYDAQRQQSVYQRLGLGQHVEAGSVLRALLLGGLLAALPMWLWWRRRPVASSPLPLGWMLLRRKLQARQIRVLPSDGPLEVRRKARALPEADYQRVKPLILRYADLRYGPAPTDAAVRHWLVEVKRLRL